MSKRPPNCGTGYCSCIECIYGKDGCVADEEQCNDGCLAQKSVIANALKLADEIDAEFFQGRISNHSGRKAAQMLRMLVDAPVQPVKQEPVAWDLAEKVRRDLDRQSCPDAYMRIAIESIVKHFPAPVSAKREWVDLTPIELAEAFSDKGSADAGIRAVIAAFKEKNK